MLLRIGFERGFGVGAVLILKYHLHFVVNMEVAINHIFFMLIITTLNRGNHVTTLDKILILYNKVQIYFFNYFLSDFIYYELTFPSKFYALDTIIMHGTS